MNPNSGYTFDVAGQRESSERQRQDSEKIVALCDTLLSSENENRTLKAKVAALEKELATMKSPSNNLDAGK